MTTNDRIIIEAQDATNAKEKQLKESPIRDYDRMVSELYGYNKGYIAGATAENDRAQVLTERLGIALENIYKIHSHLWSEFDRKEITSILEQWKSGKGKETKVYRPCPHCGKELFRDRNLCCRACGKEVGDE